MSGPANIAVERLTLHAGSMSESDARRLAELVAMALGRLPELSNPVDAAKVSVDVAAQPGRDVAQVADAVADAIAAALRIEAVS
jgi:hypothetical protein